MEAAQWAVLSLTALAAGLVSYFYNDGRDHHARLVLRADVVIGLVGTALFILGGLSPPASSVPQCDWSNPGDDLEPQCETTGEASHRAANESGGEFLDDFVIGPAYEFIGVVAGGTVGLLVAKATRRRPPDGRQALLLFDDKT